jgi:hypothetical protein
MNTAILERPARTNTAPKLRQANASDTRCEECGRSISIVLCKKCRGIGLRIENKIGDQLWSCAECGMIRAWGLLEPSDPEARPAIGCSDCNAVTRHQFVGVA